MKLRRLLLVAGFTALFLKLLENYVIEEEETIQKVTYKFSDDIDFNDNEDILDELEVMDEEKQEEVVKELSHSVHDGEKIDAKVKTGLTARQKQIINLLETNDRLDMPLIENNIKNVTPRTLRRDLDLLEKKKIIKKIGKTKGSYYIRGKMASL